MQFWLQTIYQKAFPHLVNIERNEHRDTQLKGVDCYLILRNGSHVKIEEKERQRDYGDLLLEDYSNFQKGTIGWARDTTKITEYLAYIIMPTHFAYIIFYPALRQMFIDNLDSWRQKYPYTFGKTYNENELLLYTTANIAVPFSEFPKDWLATNCWRYSG